jgi:hypothetical protein
MRLANKGLKDFGDTYCLQVQHDGDCNGNRQIGDAQDGDSISEKVATCTSTQYCNSD